MKACADEEISRCRQAEHEHETLERTRELPVDMMSLTQLERASLISAPDKRSPSSVSRMLESCSSATDSASSRATAASLEAAVALRELPLFARPRIPAGSSVAFHSRRADLLSCSLRRSGPMPQRFTKPPLRIGDHGDGTTAKPSIVGRHATANTICAMAACTRTLRCAQSS